MPKKNTLDDFWNQVNKNAANGCWEWTGNLIRSGYGVLTFNGENQLVHRLSYELANGAIPYKMCICHSCDNRLCVNPAHLWLGTYQDNMIDKVNKGRARYNPSPGENNGRAVLTEDQVRDIKANTLTASQNAKLYGVTKYNIHSIRQGKSWKHI